MFKDVKVEDIKLEKIKVTKTKLDQNQVVMIDKFIENTGAHFAHGSQDGAYYEKLFDAISMPDKEDLFTDLDYYCTKLHELTHWTMTKERTDRVAEKLDYATEELVAEIGSAFLCAYLGISKTPRKDHAKYLNAWIERIQDSEKALTKAFTLAQKSLDFLIDMQVAEEKVA